MRQVGEILNGTSNSKSPMNTKTSSSADAEPEPIGIGKPDCPYCEGLGYVVLDVPPEHPSFGRAVPCTCRAADREMARLNSVLKLSQIGALGPLYLRELSARRPRPDGDQGSAICAWPTSGPWNTPKSRMVGSS